MNPPPFWYALALRFVPGRCRAIPEATDPDRILLYQVALWSRRIYLQSFASGERVGWSHAHEGPVLCIGLWGSYTDRALVGTERRICAPYLRYMGREVWHRVSDPSRGHTSIFVVIRRERERQYVDESAVIPWQQHVKKEVVRL